MSERRLKHFVVDAKFLADLFGTGTDEATNTAPVADLEIRDVRLNYDTDRVEFVVYSATFEDVPEGAPLPEWVPNFQSEYD